MSTSCEICGTSCGVSQKSFRQYPYPFTLCTICWGNLVEQILVKGLEKGDFDGLMKLRDKLRENNKYSSIVNPLHTL